jgi:hypothetical protein
VQLARPAFALLLAGCNCDGNSQAPAVLPAELADEASLALLADWSALPVFRDGRYVQQSSEDRVTGERQQISLWDHGNRDFNNFVCRGVQADAPASKVPFVFDLPACPEAYVEGLVLSRFEGSGRLARIWLTAASIRRAAPDNELIRIYVDDEQAPRIQAPLAEMLAGTNELFGPPFGAQSARYLAWYYPLVFAKKLIVSIDKTGGEDLYFHQTDVVLDRAPEPRKAAAVRLAKRDEARSVALPLAERQHKSELVLGREPQTVQIEGPATIVKASIRVAQDRLVSLGDARLRITWDDASEPAIDLPLADLYAVWEEPAERPSLALAASIEQDQVELTLGLPMPFEKRARFVLESSSHAGDLPLVLDLGLVAGVPTERWGRLHTQRNESTEGATGLVHPIARSQGPGRLAGVCADLRGHGMQEGRKRGHPFHFLEGDETFTIDGAWRGGGTGTEDYFNGAFYFEDGPRGTHYAQVWNIAPKLPGGQARVSTCRWHVLGDTIDFASSFEMSLEIGPGVPDVLDRFLTVAYLYR